MIRSGPRESLLLAIQLLGCVWICEGLVNLILVMSILWRETSLRSAVLNLNLRAIHSVGIFRIFPLFGGPFAYFLAPTLTRLLLPELLRDGVTWNSESRIRLERFAIALIGVVLIVKAVELLAVNIQIVHGRFQFGAPIGGPVLALLLPGLLFLLAPRHLHTFVARDQTSSNR